MGLKEGGGADINGSVDVKDREGSIDIICTGSHSPFMFEKEFDSSSPYLCKTVATGQTLKSGEVRFCNINDAGQEVCY